MTAALFYRALRVRHDITTCYTKGIFCCTVLVVFSDINFGGSTGGLMKQKDLSALAGELVEQVEHYHRLEHPSPSAGEPLRTILTVLEKRHFIVANGEPPSCSQYVIRQKVTGSPLLLNGANNEIVICSQAFAHACFDAYIERRNVSLLNIIR